MKRVHFALLTGLAWFVCAGACPGLMQQGAAATEHSAAAAEHGAAQHAGHDGMRREAGLPSKTLTVTRLDGSTRPLTADDLRALPHVTVTVTNGHSHAQETYSGVAVKDVLASVATKGAEGEKISPRMTLVVAGATDHFHVALTLCDTDPGCRSGQAIVADAEDGKPLAADGAFKLILTEDKMPGRWVRNLDSLTEKNAGAL